MEVDAGIHGGGNMELHGIGRSGLSDVADDILGDQKDDAHSHANMDADHSDTDDERKSLDEKKSSNTASNEDDSSMNDEIAKTSGAISSSDDDKNENNEKPPAEEIEGDEKEDANEKCAGDDSNNFTNSVPSNGNHSLSSDPSSSSCSSDEEENGIAEQEKNHFEEDSLPNQPPLQDDLVSSSSSSEDEDQELQNKIANFPQTDESSSCSEDEEQEVENKTFNFPQESKLPSSSSSSESEGDAPDINAKQNDQKINETKKDVEDAQQIGNNKSQLHSDSESSSEDEGNNYKEEQPKNTSKLAQSLKKALEERDKQQENNEHVEDHPSSDDMSLRARSAEDFKSDVSPPPPSLPPKMAAPPALPPKSKTNSLRSNPHGIFHAPDKTASLSRGRWSDNDDEDEFPLAHKRAPLHPPPDRVIDFSQGSKSNKRSRRRHQDPSSRGVDASGRPTEDRNELYKRQAMVSLHSSAHPHQNGGTDPYDTVQEEDNRDLNKLIQEANSLDIHPYLNDKDDFAVDVLYPSYRPKSLSPTKNNLTSSYPDVFNKLAAKQSSPEPSSIPNHPIEFSAVAQGPFTEYPKNLPKKRKSNKEEPLLASQDPQDGDDEISLAESDFRFASLPAEDTSKSIEDTPYLCEVYPSDFTDFDSVTDADDKPNPLHHDITPYDTVADTDLEGPGNNLNPIVSEDYQICTAPNKNHSTFPRRMKEDKPQPKQRTNLDSIMAVPLTDPSTNSHIQPTSLPFLGGKTPLRRNKSNPDFVMEPEPVSLFGQTPHVVVTRGPASPEDRKAELPLSYSGPRSLPVPKKKAKSKPDAPKIHLSLGRNSRSTSDTDNTVISNPKNLQINLLPSEDPNVINLNIRSASSPPLPPKEKELPIVHQPPPVVVREPSPGPSPLTLQPMVPITAITHVAQPPPDPEEVNPPLSQQHRVVDIAPVVISTAPLQPEVTPMIFSQPEVVPTAPSPEPVQQPYQFTPQQQIQSVMVPPHQPILTQETRVFNSPRTESSPPPRDPVIEVQNPSIDRSRSLPPNSQPENNMRHGGDSGIDLTNYEGRARATRVSSSSEDSDYDGKRRMSRGQIEPNRVSEQDLSNEHIEWYKRKYLKPTCCYLFLKHFIFILNLIFGIVGLALMGLGIWGFADLLNSGLDEPENILRNPIFPLFIIGTTMTLVCFQGAVGFFRDNICMIKFFGWFMVFLCFLFVGGGISFWVMREGKVTQFVSKTFEDMITQYNATSGKVAAFTIDQMQRNFECCGMKKSDEWQRNSAFPCREFQCALPPSCCHAGEIECSRPEANDELRKTCLNAMALWVKNNTAILVGVWLIIILLFLVNFICIYFMIREVLRLRAIEDKIRAMVQPQSDLESSSDSEYEERQRRRRRRKRRERRNRKKRGAYVNKSYR